MSNEDTHEKNENGHEKVTLKATLDELSAHWKALLAATLGIGFGVATLVYYTTGLFVPELEAEYGWTLSELSLLPLIGSVISIIPEVSIAV